MDFKHPSALSIGIVGCGTAGPAAAILLARQGHRVQVFDKAAGCRAVGAGVMLQPTGMSVLQQMGLLDQILPLGSHVSALLVWEHQRTLMKLEYEDWKPGSFGLGLHRPVLLQVLLDAMEKAGVSLHWDREILDAHEHDGRWTLDDDEGEQQGPFDLLIIADGARSSLRRFVSPAAVDHSYPWGAHWFIGENRGAFASNKLHQIVDGTRVLCGFLPTGRSSPDAPELVSLFWSIPLADDAAIRAKPLDEWKANILRYEPQAAALLAQITDWSQIITARYGDVRLLRWSGRGIVVLGDAAHAMSPQLGQGVNLALMDAACLADCVGKYPLPLALKKYTRRRFAHICYYRAATRGLTPFFQSSCDWLALPRRLMFRAMQPIRPLRHLMTRSMAGVMFSGR